MVCPGLGLGGCCVVVMRVRKVARANPPGSARSSSSSLSCGAALGMGERGVTGCVSSALPLRPLRFVDSTHWPPLTTSFLLDQVCLTTRVRISGDFACSADIDMPRFCVNDVA